MLAPSPEKLLPPKDYCPEALDRCYSIATDIRGEFRALWQKLTFTGKVHPKELQETEEAAFLADVERLLQAFPDMDREHAIATVRSRPEHFPLTPQEVLLQEFVRHHEKKQHLDQVALRYFNLPEESFPLAASKLKNDLHTAEVATKRRSFRHNIYSLLDQGFEHQSKAYGLMYCTSELPYLYPEDYDHLRDNNTAYHAAKMNGLTLMLQNPVWYRSYQKTLLQDFLEHGLLSPDDLTTLKNLSQGDNKEKVLRVINEANNELMRLQTN